MAHVENTGVGPMAGGRQYRVMLAGDGAVVRAGLRSLVEERGDLQVTLELDRIEDAGDLLTDDNTDLLVLIQVMRETDVLDTVKAIRARFPFLPVLVVSMLEESVYAERALCAGAQGYVMLKERATTIMKAVRSTLRGDSYVSRRMVALLLDTLTGDRGRHERHPVDALSDRELQVFQLMGTGMSTRFIADHMHLSVKTIETYRERLKNKLGLHNGDDLRKEAVEWVRYEDRESSTAPA